MPQLLSLSRAARLAGISRGELQEEIRRQGIPTFEGKIALDALLQAYPEIDVDRDPVLERISLIKSAARPKRKYTDHWLPEPEVLMARLQDFQQVLIRTKAALNNTEALLAEVTTRLESAVASDDSVLREAVADLGQRLRLALDKAEARPDRRAELFAKDAMLRILAASARILPSGHEFFVEGRESILEAGIRAGLHLNYGCSSGNCGTCRVRVVKGEVRKIRDHDYVLSALEREQGYCLACSNTAVTDLVLEASEALSPADLPEQEIRCVLRTTQALSEDLILVGVQTPRTQTLRFMAGQRVVVTLESGLSRELAVASCPCDACNLQFLIRRRPGDDFSAALSASAKGSTLLIRGPRGDFRLAEEATEPSVFVAVGDGFGAIKSLIEHAIAIDNVPRMHLFRIDTVPPRSLLDNLCRSWHDALDNFYYQRLDSATSPAKAIALIAAACPDLDKCRLYVAGPEQWVGAFTAEAAASGAQEDFIRRDIVD